MGKIPFVARLRSLLQLRIGLARVRRSLGEAGGSVGWVSRVGQSGRVRRSAASEASGVSQSN